MASSRERIVDGLSCLEVVDSPPVHSDSSLPRSSDWRDWASVDAGPAGLIAETVLRRDIADFLRFRAACGAWRRCSAHLRPRGALDRRFHPRRWGWIMLPNAFNVRFRRRFRNVRTGERALLEIPDIHRCYVLGTTSEGLVLVCRTDTYAVQLLNPLTGQIAGLPHAATLLGTTERVDSRVRDLKLRSAGLMDDDSNSTVVMHFESLFLAVAKPGGESWTRLRFQNKIMAALPFAGRIYCATAKNVSVVKIMPNHQPPQLVRVADHNLDTRDRKQSRLYLVDNDGELLLSYCAPYNYDAELANNSDYDSDDEEAQALYHPTPPTFMGYQVKLDTGKIEPLGRLDGQALVIGASCSLVVAAGVSLSIKADTVYFCGGRLALDLLGGSVERWSFNKGDVAYDLSRYACRP